MELREYQKKAVDDLRNAFKTYKNVLYCLPTGAGKTAIFSYITSRISERNKSVYILVHRQELLLQASKKLAEYGIPHGRISANSSISKDLIQVCSVQTFANRLRYYNKPDLIIIDECHHAVASSYQAILNYYPIAKVLGVTATPERLDGNGLGSIFQKLIIGPGISELIDMGYLSRVKVFAPQQIDFSRIKTSQGDYSKNQASEILDTPKITGNAIEHYRKYATGKPGIVFCVTIKHAHDVANEFNLAGIPAKCIDGTMDSQTRKQIIAGLGVEYKILTSCDIVSEGTDIPAVSVAILLRPTLSLGLYLQQVGRCLRPYPGKDYAIVLDHVGNCHRHGLPDDEREWSLNSVKRTRKSIEEKVKIRTCSKCYTVFNPTKTTCPNCNEQYEIINKLPEIEEGELEEVKKQEQINKRRMIAQAKDLKTLQEVGKKLGYNPGWAFHVFEARNARKY